MMFNCFNDAYANRAMQEQMNLGQNIQQQNQQPYGFINPYGYSTQINPNIQQQPIVNNQNMINFSNPQSMMQQNIYNNPNAYNYNYNPGYGQSSLNYSAGSSYNPLNNNDIPSYGYGYIPQRPIDVFSYTEDDEGSMIICNPKNIKIYSEEEYDEQLKLADKKRYERSLKNTAGISSWVFNALDSMTPTIIKFVDEEDKETKVVDNTGIINYDKHMLEKLAESHPKKYLKLYKELVIYDEIMAVQLLETVINTHTAKDYVDLQMIYEICQERVEHFRNSELKHPELDYRVPEAYKPSPVMCTNPDGTVKPIGQNLETPAPLKSNIPYEDKESDPSILAWKKMVKDVQMKDKIQKRKVARGVMKPEELVDNSNIQFPPLSSIPNSPFVGKSEIDELGYDPYSGDDELNPVIEKINPLDYYNPKEIDKQMKNTLDPYASIRNIPYNDIENEFYNHNDYYETMCHNMKLEAKSKLMQHDFYRLALKNKFKTDEEFEEWWTGKPDINSKNIDAIRKRNRKLQIQQAAMQMQNQFANCIPESVIYKFKYDALCKRLREYDLGITANCTDSRECWEKVTPRLFQRMAQVSADEYQKKLQYERYCNRNYMATLDVIDKENIRNRLISAYATKNPKDPHPELAIPINPVPDSNGIYGYDALGHPIMKYADDPRMQKREAEFLNYCMNTPMHSERGALGV